MKSEHFEKLGVYAVLETKHLVKLSMKQLHWIAYGLSVIGQELLPTMKQLLYSKKLE